jgi:hypothetical protein
VYSAIFISSFNSLKTLPEDGNSLFSENSQNISDSNSDNNKQHTSEPKFLEKSQTELESELELSSTDFFGNIQKITKKDEEIGKGLYDYFKSEVHRKEKPHDFDSKYQIDSLKNKIEKNGYQLYENLINLVEKQPDRIMKVDSHEMMHFSENQAKFKEVVSGLRNAEKTFKFKEIYNFIDDNKKNESIKKDSKAPFDDGPIDFGNFNFNFNGFLG